MLAGETQAYKLVSNATLKESCVFIFFYPYLLNQGEGVNIERKDTEQENRGWGE